MRARSAVPAPNANAQPRRVLINARIAAGYALTLRLRHHWYLVVREEFGSD